MRPRRLSAAAEVPATPKQGTVLPLELVLSHAARYFNHSAVRCKTGLYSDQRKFKTNTERTGLVLPGRYLQKVCFMCALIG